MVLSSLPTKNSKAGRSIGGKATASTSAPVTGKADLPRVSLDTRLTTLYASLAHSSDLNPLIDLIDTLGANLLSKFNDKHAQALRKGVQFLLRSLQALLKDDRIPLHNCTDDGLAVLVGIKGEDEEADGQDAVTRWLQTRWNDATTLLCQLLGCSDEETRSLALHALLSLQRDASVSVTKTMSKLPVPERNMGLDAAATRGQWSRSPWIALTSALLAGPPKLGVDARHAFIAQDVIDEFTEKYLQQYDDVRFAFCRSISDALQKKDVTSQMLHQQSRRNAVQFLFGVTAIPTKEEHLNTFLVPSFALDKRGSKRKAKQSDADEEEDAAADDWFSDSDDEGNGTSTKKNAIAGLGSAAISAAESRTAKRRLKRNPPFHDAVQSLAAQRAAYSRAWLSILLPTRDAKGQAIGGAMTVAMTHEALVRMHAQIIPHLSKPNLLHDFLVDALDSGGATALLALNTLFTLMTKHNLNYPAFYARLYALLLADPPFLHVRYRSRFLRLLDVFLSSSHLPAALIASFAKRLARAALRAPPAAIVVVLPFVWNLCKRHKPCLRLIHREFGNDRFDAGPAGLEDPYDALETDPLKTNAIESSLWELAALGATLGAAQQTTGAGLDGEAGEGQQHYLATVSSLSRILAEPFTKERYGLEDFLDLTYGTMFETETAKTLKKREGKRVIEPAVAFDAQRHGKHALLFASSKQSDESRAKRVKLGDVVGADDEEDADLLEARQAMKDLDEATHIDICSRIFAF